MTLGILFGVFALFLLVELPVGFSLALSSLGVIWSEQQVPMTIVVQRMASGIESFPFLAIPLFILAGNLMNRAGIATRIYGFALALMGHIRGSLAHVNVLASMIFAGMSGVAQADAAGIGTIEIKHMKEQGFDPAFSAAVSAASAVIGPIIPPSVIMVVYAVNAQASVADLFLAGVIPGVLMGFALMAMIYWMAVTGRIVAPTQPRASLAEVGRSFREALPALAAPVLLCGGIVVGVATPTELGALTVVYAIVLGFVQRELTWQEIWDAAVETLITYGVLVFIIAAAVPFGWVVAVTEAPDKLARFLLSLSENKWVILGLINVLLLIAGCFMETTAILLIATPTLLPLVKQLGVHEVHFGLMMIVNLLIGALTPPFGVLLFITMDIAKVSFGAIVRAILPFYVPLAVCLLLVTYWPDMVMFLPELFRD
ncbi:MAG: TRAP transporter large permease [Alphaproteobacteria bacterium]|nr:TRAP transporter large permease [Alphaproteobacteria bacterium]